MEVKAGYQKTEAGLLPVDWEVAPLGSFVGITSGASPSLFRFSGGCIPYFKVEQLSSAEKYLDATDTPYLFDRGDTVPGQSVMFAKRGAAIALNKVRILKQASFMDTNLMALTPREGLECEYLYYALEHIGLWRFADTTSIPQINNKHVKPLSFPLPSLPEQRAIATALSDVDALLDGLDRLIAKKRDLKQAAMQQLLTGKKRLPGFHGEWEVKAMPKVCWFQEGPGVRNTQFTTSGVKLLNGTNIFRGRISLDTTERFISQSEAHGPYAHFLAECGDIVIACSGISVAKFHEKVAVVSAEHLPFCMNTSTMRFKPNLEDLAPSYLSHFLMSDIFKRQIAPQATGSAQLNFGPSHVSKVTVPLPAVPEQSAIAAVLSDMDAELTALTQRRDKTRALKQGMMQELLTGRTRLV